MAWDLKIYHEKTDTPARVLCRCVANIIFNEINLASIVTSISFVLQRLDR